MWDASKILYLPWEYGDGENAGCLLGKQYIAAAQCTDTLGLKVLRAHMPRVKCLLKT